MMFPKYAAIRHALRHQPGGADPVGGVIPVGGIILWSGAITAIPSGWALCDGANGTPNLEDRFVVGAGYTYAVGALGGLSTVTLTQSNLPSHTHTASSGSEGSHGHTASTGSTGAHDHALHQAQVRNDAANIRAVSPASTVATNTLPMSGTNGAHAHTVSVGTEPAHTHTVSVGSTGGSTAFNNRPPYYALAYIMRTI